MTFTFCKVCSIALRPLMSLKGNSVCTDASFLLCLKNCLKLPFPGFRAGAGPSSKRKVKAFLQERTACSLSSQTLLNSSPLVPKEKHETTSRYNITASQNLCSTAEVRPLSSLSLFLLPLLALRWLQKVGLNAAEATDSKLSTHASAD